MDKRIFSFILMVLCIYNTSNAQFPDTYFESNYGLLKYGFYIPEDYDSSKAYPLVMYLHGMGNDYSVYLDWYNRDIQTKNPCFVYTPKTPISWADWSGWNYQLTEPMQAALHVLDSMITVYSIDQNRLYVYGISMGGEGVFDLLHKLPNKFAAAMSVCGGGRASWAEEISNTPLWMFHGGQDRINPPSLTELVYEELIRIGATKMRYKKYPAYGHEIWDLAAREPSWHDWMFAHSMDDTSCSKPGTPIVLTGEVLNNNAIQLSWNDIRNPNEMENNIWYYNIYNKDSVIGTAEYNELMYFFYFKNLVDTFKVSAVNYHFQESDKSNMVCFENGSIVTGVNNIISENISIPHLFQNYPNPFNPETVIGFQLSVFGHVTLKVFDVLGKEVAVLVDEEKASGYYEVSFSAGTFGDTDKYNLASGIYFYRISAGEFVSTRKFILLK